MSQYKYYKLLSTFCQLNFHLKISFLISKATPDHTPLAVILHPVKNKVLNVDILLLEERALPCLFDYILSLLLNVASVYTVCIYLFIPILLFLCQ